MGREGRVVQVVLMWRDVIVVVVVSVIGAVFVIGVRVCRASGSVALFLVARLRPIAKGDVEVAMGQHHAGVCVCQLVSVVRQGGQRIVALVTTYISSKSWCRG